MLWQFASNLWLILLVFMVDTVQRLKLQDVKYYSIISYPYWFYMSIFCHKINQADTYMWQVLIEADNRGYEENNDDTPIFLNVYD